MATAAATDLRKSLVYTFAPLTRFLPPWWRWRVYQRSLGNPFLKDGFEGVVRTARLRPHGYELELALDSWVERFAYFGRSYYDPTTVGSLQALLRPGDCFVDIGANLGMISLTAARLVGDEGRVLAFEPNKRLAERLEEILRKNRVTNVEVFAVALGDEEGSAHLESDVQHVAASLRTQKGSVVPVRRGEDFAHKVPPEARALVKIDVEGYEQRVLAGIGSLVRRPDTAFFIEITDPWLRELGGSAQQVFDLFKSEGYSCFLPEMDYLSRLRFRPTDGPAAARQYDALFVRPNEGWFRS